MTHSPICSAETAAHAHVLAPLPSPEEAGDRAGGAADPAGAPESPLWKEAYQKGAEDACRRAEAEEMRSAGALAEAAEQLRSLERGFLPQIQADVLRLSLAIARQVVMAELRVNRGALAEVIARLLDEAEDRKVVAVRLHPEDAARINRSAAARALAKAGIEVQPSPDVGRGGVILETGFGKLDARVETRLEEITTALLGENAAACPDTASASGDGADSGFHRGRTASTDGSGAASFPISDSDEGGESLWETQPAYSASSRRNEPRTHENSKG